MGGVPYTVIIVWMPRFTSMLSTCSLAVCHMTSHCSPGLCLRTTKLKGKLNRTCKSIIYTYSPRSRVRNSSLIGDQLMIWSFLVCKWPIEYSLNIRQVIDAHGWAFKDRTGKGKENKIKHTAFLPTFILCSANKSCLLKWCRTLIQENIQ